MHSDHRITAVSVNPRNPPVGDNESAAGDTSETASSVSRLREADRPAVGRDEIRIQVHPDRIGNSVAIQVHIEIAELLDLIRSTPAAETRPMNKLRSVK